MSQSVLIRTRNSSTASPHLCHSQGMFKKKTKSPTIGDLTALAHKAGLTVHVELIPKPPSLPSKAEVQAIISRLRKASAQPDHRDVLKLCEVVEKIIA